MDFFIDPARAVGDPTKVRPENDDSDDDKTILGGEMEEIDQKMLEFSVKWSFTKMSDETAARKALVELLTLMLQLHSDHLTLIDHNGQEFDMNPEMNEEKHAAWIRKEFKAPLYKAQARRQQRYRNNTYNRMYATHKIQTKISLSTIKSHYLLRECMKKHNVFLNVHNFALEKWDIAHLGFLQGYNVIHVNKQQSKIRLAREIQAVDAKTPDFELTTTKVRSPPIDGETFMTQAYEVQCVRENSHKVYTTLTNSAFAKRLAFIPYSCKYSHAKEFRQAVLMQTKNSADMWVIKVQGFTHEAMVEFASILKVQPGYHTVTPTKRLSELGEWKILVNREKIADFYEWLTSNLHMLIAEVLGDFMIPQNYPDYEVTSRDPTMHYEEKDENTDAGSFGTMFTNTMEEAAPGINEEGFKPMEFFPDLPQAITTRTRNQHDVKNKSNTKTNQATFAEIAALPPRDDNTNNGEGKHPGKRIRKKHRYGNATREQIRRQIVPGRQNHHGNGNGNDETSSISDRAPTPTTTDDFNVSSLSEQTERHLQKLSEDLRIVNAAHKKASEDHALQIAGLTAEMEYLRAGMNALLRNQGIQAPAAASMATTLTVIDEQEGPPSSNKRKSVSTTPTKTRPDSLPTSPDADIEMQQTDDPQNNNPADDESQSTTSSSESDAVQSVASTEDVAESYGNFVGDVLQENKPDNVTRLYAQNIQGIRWDKDGGTWPMICNMITSIHADISCFSELNVDADQYKVSGTMRSVERKFFTHSRFAASTSKNKVPHAYKPGGTGIMVVEDTTATIKKMVKDRMGRWVIAHLTGDGGSKLAIISAYQVCKSRVAGNNNAANCQIAQLMTEPRTTVDTSPDPRKAFITELTQIITQFQAGGAGIILVGDFNEDIEDSTHRSCGISTLATTCELADLFSIRLGTASQPATYNRGSKRIDYALISPSLLPMIRSAGYDPFDYRIPSDHRGFFIDFDTKALLGYKPTALAPHAYREFNSRHPRVVANYITAITTELTSHDFWDRITQLQETEVPCHRFAERLDRDLTRATKHAANKVKRRYQTPWSPVFAEAWAAIHFYHLARSKYHHPQRNISEGINQLRRKYPHLPATVPDDLDDIKAGVKEAYARLREARQHSERLREEYLEERAKLYAALEEMGNMKAVERLKRAESLSRTFRKLSALRMAGSNSGLTEIDVPLDPETHPKNCNEDESYWRTEKVPSEIEKLLLARNESHFGQAEGTPFTVGPLKTALNYHGDGPVAELILQGAYSDDTLDEATSLFVNHLQKKTDTLLTGEITAQDFLNKIKKWDERTSTSPSGTHLGHYHVLWRHHGLKGNDPRSAVIADGQTDVVSARVALLNYSTKFGYSYDRWKKVVNVMIKKDVSTSRIHRLRVIHLYEADYNLLLALKWRQALHHAEDSKLLNDGLYGSRPGRSAIDPVLLETFQNEIYRCSMKTGIAFNLDATSCYDRILASISSLASRGMGIDPRVTRMHSTTLDEARFQLKTSIGISESSYRNTPMTPIHGTGQGSGNSPHVWTFISNALFNAYESRAQGATFASFNGLERQTVHMIGFVDDCSQRLNYFSSDPQPTATRLVEQMTVEAQLWRNLLYATGGELELPKCFFQLIQTDFRPNGRPFLRGGVFAPPIPVSNQATTELIQQKASYTSNKTLGCFVNPNGGSKTQFSVLHKKSDHHALLLQTNVLTKKEVHINYWSIYLPSITYCLPVCNLTQDQCYRIQTKFMSAAVCRVGLSRTIPLPIRYGPKSYACAGFTELFTEQHHLTVTAALKHLRTPTSQLGQTLRILLSWVQAFHGRSVFVWADPSAPLPDFPAPWINGVRSALRSIRGSIILSADDPIMQKPLRENDEFIMDAAMQYTSNGEWIERINACRRYLQVVTLADIADPAGSKFLPAAKTGDDKEFGHLVLGEHFNQRKPPSFAWKTWNKFLQTFETDRGLLRSSLRDWIQPISSCRWKQPFVLDPLTESLFHYTNREGYVRMSAMSPDSFYLEPSTPAIPPLHCYPVKAFGLAQIVRVLRIFHTTEEDGALRPEDTFEDYIGTLASWEQLLLKRHTLLATPLEIANSINDGTAFIASDGSVLNNIASFGYVIASSAHRRLIRGSGPSVGLDPSSFRAELYGCLAAVCMLHRISVYTGVSLTSDYEHYIDNKAAIAQLRREETSLRCYANRTLIADWDVISAVVAVTSKLPTHRYEWTKGHQDATVARNTLPFSAQLNCEADDEAGLYQRENTRCVVVPMMPGTKAQLVIDGCTITSHYKHRIREAATLPKYLAYVQKKFKWDDVTNQTIDWPCYKTIVHKFRRTTPMTLLKHVHEMAPTGLYSHRNQSFQSECCPVCECPTEDNDHVLLCPAVSRAKWRSGTLASIHSGQELFIQDPVLLDVLRDGIQRWFNSYPPIDVERYPPRYHSLILNQNRIGWSHLFRGRWSVHWRRLHIEYATSHMVTGEAADGMRWVKQLGVRLVTAWFDLWEIRNSERHGREAADILAKRGRDLRKRLEDLYACKHQVLAADRALFLTDAATHIEHRPHLDGLEDWLNTYEAAIRHSVKENRDRRTHFFRRGGPAG